MSLQRKVHTAVVDKFILNLVHTGFDNIGTHFHMNTILFVNIAMKILRFLFYLDTL